MGVGEISVIYIYIGCTHGYIALYMNTICNMYNTVSAFYSARTLLVLLLTKTCKHDSRVQHASSIYQQDTAHKLRCCCCFYIAPCLAFIAVAHLIFTYVRRVCGIRTYSTCVWAEARQLLRKFNNFFVVTDKQYIIICREMFKQLIDE